MKAWLGQSIARKLLASFVGIFSITYLLTAIFVFTSVRNSMLRTEADALTHLANQKIGLASSHLQGVATNLHAWSHLEVMNDLISGDVDKRVARTLSSLKIQYGLAGEIYAFDAQDALVASSAGPALRAQLPAVWPSQGSEPTLVDLHTNPLASGPVVALSSTMQASFSSNFKMGTLVVTLPWSSVEKLFDAGAQRIVLYKSTPPALLSSGSGQRPLEQAALQALIARVPELQIAATRYVAGYSDDVHPLLRNWRVAALKESRIANLPVETVAIKLVGLGLLLAIPIVLVIRWLSRRLTEPVQSLTRVVADITSSGDLSRRARVDARDELGTLAVAFNGMAENLQRISHEREEFVGELELLNKTLEQRVHERTQALASANSELTGAIASLKSTQSQLVHSEKMAALGQLVAGVAHELNNPIGFIYANFPHLEQYTNDLLSLVATMSALPMDQEHKRLVGARIEEIDLEFIRSDALKIIRSGQAGAARIKEIVSSLRSFSRLDEAELKPVILEDGINDTLAILHHKIKNRIEVIKDYRLNEPVLCRAGQINQVFMNIIYNALQAIEGRGTLRIATRKEGKFAIVSIADSGQGIAADVIGKIFDPFFTTKKVGEGTGLGLSISYGIVEKHGGHIDVASVPGQGATFTVSIHMKPEPNQTPQQEAPVHES